MQRILVVTRAALVALSLLATMASASHAQATTLEGTVFADGTQHPLANAEISLSDVSLTATSDSSGNFSILRVPVGSHQLTIRLIGYEAYSATVMFYESRPFSADFLLKKLATQLANVSVSATAGAAAPYATRLAEFDARRHTSGGGSYVTADVFEKNDGRKVADILSSKIPGLRTRCTAGQCFAYSTQSSMTFKQKGGDCYTTVVMNGIIAYNSSPGQSLFDLNAINTRDIIGVEFHTVASTPAQYNATGTMCGALLIWTKSGGAN